LLFQGSLIRCESDPVICTLARKTIYYHCRPFRKHMHLQREFGETNWILFMDHLSLYDQL